MSWFKKWLFKKMQRAYHDSQIQDIECVSTGSIGLSRTLDSDAAMSFTIYNAIGGKVVEFRRYDRQRDRSEHTMYVVGNDEDFGQRIAKIATIETLKS
jgi:hypothetical protein